MAPVRIPAIVCLVGALLGLTFGVISTLDYAAHLDRQVHDLHCSIIPGAAAAAEQAVESGCRVAMNSPYGALMRDRLWGGIPIGLFAVGAFSFFAAFAAYLALAGARAPRHAVSFFALAALSPLAVSIGMATLSALELGSFCKTCIGIYVSSLVLSVGGVVGWWRVRKAAPGASDGRTALKLMHVVTWLCVLAGFAITPALVYARSVPSYGAKVRGCGTLASTDDPDKALLHVASRGAVQPVVMVVDPLCPSCKGFHQRLVTEGIFDKLDTTLVLFPLDSECNWNLSTPLHPGACAVARAVICGDTRAIDVLEWAYQNQDALLAAAKKQDGEEEVLALVDARFPGTRDCANDKKTRARLDAMMRFAVRNKLEVATPQLFVGDQRLCDEDSDIGLSYALHMLAPPLRKP
jgi:uncharacterized membrane protein